MKLWNFIKEKMLNNPSQIICEGDAKMSYEDLVIFSEIFSEKINGEQRCAILCNSEMASAMGVLACFAAGVTAIPISLRYGEQHCRKIFDTVCPTAMITDVYGELSVVRFEESPILESEHHPALIMCTSGTTGMPKGAMLSENNIISNVNDICAYFDLNSKDSILIARPLYHCAVLTGEFLTSLVKGIKIHFLSSQFNPIQILKIISENNITTFCGTPTLLSTMAKFKRKEPTSLVNICISGECMDKECAKKISSAFPHTNIYHVYGLTEAGPRVSYLHPSQFSKRPDSVGVPLKSVSIKIEDKNGNIAKPGEEGILYIKGDNVMLGYYNAPEQTKKSLQNGWLCTGDIAVVDSEGFMKIKGRNDDLIIRAGMNIYPQEIERTLKSNKKVNEALAYGIYDKNQGAQICLKISGDFISEDEVRQLCIQLLPSYQVPTKIELVKELPKNGSGKIVRPKFNSICSCSDSRKENNEFF